MGPWLVGGEHSCACPLRATPQQTSGGTGSGRLAQEVRAVSDGLSLGIRSARQPLLPQKLLQLVRALLIDDLPAQPHPDSPNQLRPREPLALRRGPPQSLRHPACSAACCHRG